MYRPWRCITRARASWQCAKSPLVTWPADYNTQSTLATVYLALVTRNCMSHNTAIVTLVLIYWLLIDWIDLIARLWILPQATVVLSCLFRPIFADELLQANSTSTASDNSNADQLFRVAGFQAHSKSFRKYAQTVERNLKISQTESDKLCDSISFGNGKLVSNSNAVFDDPVSKVAAWWTALQTASQLALIGYEVVTGSIDRPIGLQSGEGVFLCAL